MKPLVLQQYAYICSFSAHTQTYPEVFATFVHKFSFMHPSILVFYGLDIIVIIKHLSVVTGLHCFCLQLQRVVVPGLLLKTENTARLVVHVSILSQYVFYQQMCMCCFDAGFVIHFFPYLIKVMLHTLWTTALYKSFTFF